MDSLKQQELIALNNQLQYEVKALKEREAKLVTNLKTVYETHLKIGWDESNYLRRPEIMHPIKNLLEELGVWRDQ